MNLARNSQKLDQMFFALADASRRTMIDRLSKGPASVSELARPLDMAMPSVVKHLAVLEAGGVVISEKRGRIRTYTIVPAALTAIETWVAQRKARMDAAFDRLDDYLRATRRREKRTSDVLSGG
jgi:DNA-binding transcriptional ArsR family regulator